MSFLIGVVIDNSRIVWIHDSERSASSPVRLTTVTDHQQKAEISFYIKHTDRKTLLCTETLRNLPPMPAGEPSIDIKPGHSGKSFIYDIYINGQRVKQGSCKLSPYIKSKVPVIAAVAVVAAALLTLLIMFVLMPILKNTQETQTYRTEPQEQTVSAEPAAEQPQRKELPDGSTGEKETAEEQRTEVLRAAAETPPEPEPAEQVFVESEITDRHSVYFRPDSAHLTREALSELDAFIESLPGEDDFEEGVFKLEVRGHCARYGTEEGRDELSRERALNVYNYLKTEWGIEADSFISGAGATEPVSLKRDEQHLNRRVDINIKGNITQVKQ